LDVKYSFDRITSKEAAPQFRTYFSEVVGVVVVSEREIRFNFKRANAELPLIVGGMSVFSHKWGADKPLDKVITDVPIGSGPYKLGQVDFGKDIQYVRDKNYWAKNLNVRKGMFNFDRISYRLYKDTTAQFEGFKAGEFDYIQAFVAREWARGYKGKLFDNGTLIKKELQHGNAGDFQGFMFNTRLPKFKDARVRQAIGLAMDYEWMNRQLFYQAYTRVRGYFVGSDFEAQLFKVFRVRRDHSPHGARVIQKLYRESLTLGVAQSAIAVSPTRLRQQVAGQSQMVTQGVARGGV